MTKVMKDITSAERPDHRDAACENSGNNVCGLGIRRLFKSLARNTV
jgi:hypothetical protein